MDIPRSAPRKRRRSMIAIGALLLGSVAVWGAMRFDAAAPSVRSRSLVLSEVERGPLTRAVRGPGNLVAEQVRWVPSIVSGRVERRLVEPGAEVQADTLLVLLSNPELELELLQAETQLAAARASLVNLETALASRNLEQRALLASARARFADAQRAVASADRLEPEGLLSSIEAANQRELAGDLRAQMEIALERLEIFEASTPHELAVQALQVDNLEQVVEAHRARIAALEIVAGIDGVLQDIELGEGQWVQPGATVGRVIQPDRLKAVLRIPQLQAKEVALGQPVTIDTRGDTVPGHVARIDPTVVDGVVQVDVALASPLPAGSRPDLAIDGMIEIERLEDVLHVGIPSMARAFSESTLFKVEDDRTARRVDVRYGRTSVRRIEVVGGLSEGDRIILSDTAAWRDHTAIRLR